MKGMHEQAFLAMRMFTQTFQEKVHHELKELHGVGKTLADPKVRETFYRNVLNGVVVKAVKMMYHTVAAAGEGDDFGGGQYPLKPMSTGFEGLKWFRETPKKPGLYLWRPGYDPNYFYDEDGHSVYLTMEVAIADEKAGTLKYRAAHREDWKELNTTGQWFGPIPAAWPPAFQAGQKVSSVDYSEPVPQDNGELMTVSDFKHSVNDGLFNDEDGAGHPVRDGKISYGNYVYPSRTWEIPEDATHIMWFNK